MNIFRALFTLSYDYCSKQEGRSVFLFLFTTMSSSNLEHEHMIVFIIISCVRRSRLKRENMTNIFYVHCSCCCCILSMNVWQESVWLTKGQLKFCTVIRKEKILEYISTSNLFILLVSPSSLSLLLFLQIIPAHSTSVVACTFSPDGKYLATYSSGENKLCFWQVMTANP